MSTRVVPMIGAFLLGLAPFSPAIAQPYTATRTNDIVQLEDQASGTVVSIITSVGNIAYEMKVKGHNILRFPFASIDDFRAKPARIGIPLLAPWGNRLDEQAFYANGRRFPFDMQLGNITGAIPIHGFLSLTEKWQTIEMKHDATAAWLTARLDVYKQPAWMKQWPFAHTIEMTYRLAGGALEVRTKLVNMSAEPMPVAIGYHPWLQLTDSPREEWTVMVPARTRWLLNWQKVPTGVTEPTDGFLVDGKAALKDYNIDDVFSDLVRDAQGRVTTTVTGRRQQIEVTQGPNYRALIVYSPNPAGTGRGSQIPPPNPDAPAAGAAPTRPAQPPPPANPLATPNFICIEPMAAITNALNLAHRGVYKDLQSIPPGGTWEESFWIRTRGFERPPATPSPAPTSAPTGWTLVFSDEFDTPGALDASKWGYETGYIRNKEAQYYTSRAENVRTEGGNLVIEGRKEPFQGFGYTSASINTLGRFEFLYGRVEVRARIPTGNGTWPAIWMLGVNRKDVGWPACGEIDIMENVGFDPLRIVGSIHTKAYNHMIGTQKSANVTLPNPWEDFHIYAMEWYPDRIDIFVDGQKYFSFRNEGTGSATWPFDKPQYLLLNLAIGGSWGGQRGIDDTRFPHRYLVDYVRIYQQK